MNFDNIRFEKQYPNFKMYKLSREKRLDYKGLPIECVTLPDGVIEIIERNNINFSKTDIDKMYIILNMIYIFKYSIERPYCRINKNNLEMIHRHYYKIINFLKDNEIITTTKEDSSEKTYEVDKLSIGYKLHHKFLTSSMTVVNLSKTTFINSTKTGSKLKTWYNNLITNIENNWTARISLYYQQDIKSIIIPTTEFIEEKAKRLVDEKKCNKKGKQFKFFKDESLKDETEEKNYRKTYSDIEYGIKQFKSLNSEEGPAWTLPTSSGVCGRTTDKFNLMSGWVREEFKFVYNGRVEEMVELDFTALHPNIWSLLLPYIPENEINFFMENVAGDSHTKIANYVGLERKEVKTLFLSFFNTKIEYMKNGKFKKIWDFYEKNMPSLLDLIVKTKENGHANTSTFLFNNEAILIENIMIYCYLNKIPVAQVYDAVYIPKSVSEQVKNKVNSFYNRNELTTTIG